MLRLIGLCWILGIALIGQVHPYLEILASQLWWFVAIITVFGYLALWRFNQLSKQFILKWLLCALGGCAFFALGWQFSNYHLSQRLALEVTQKQTIEGTVYIDKISDGKIESWRQKAQLLIPQQNRSIQILLYPKRIYDQDGEVIGFTTDQFKLGQFYQATLEIKPPHGYANPGSFDQEKWLLQENIQATAIVRFSQPISAKQVTILGWHQFVNDQLSTLKKWQLNVEKLRLQYRTHLLTEPVNHSNALLLGLLTGDRSGIDQELTLLYQQMGISHLLAISGPHVLILASLVTGILMWLIHCLMHRGRYSKLYLFLPKQQLYIPIFLACVTFYLAFTGFELPALRTWWMVFLLSICVWMRWRVSTFTLMIVVASLVLWIDCFAVLSAAFWLSFGASAILLMIYQQIQQQKVEGFETFFAKMKRVLHLLWQSQWRIFVALLPIVLWQFKAVSLIAPFVNLIAIPFLSVLIVPVDIIAAMVWQVMPPLGNGLWWISATLLSIFNGFLHILQPIAKILYLPSALTSIELLCLVIALTVVSMPQGLIHRLWAVLFLIPLFLPIQHAILQLDVLDVGQGQALVLRTQKHQMVIDTGMGAWQSNQATMGDRVVVPFLQSQGIQTLDELLLTHMDLDHSGGAAAVITQLKVKQLRSNVAQQDKTVLGKVPFVRCDRGQNWQWDGVNIQILWPLAADSRKNANESSCVMLVEVPMKNQTFKLLLMGDTGWEAEYHLLQDYPNLQADVIVLGHHGSKYSSAYDFLKQIQPKLAITSSGLDNRYGHPTQETLARLADLNIAHLDTTQTGQIHLQLSAQQQYWQWSAYRLQRQWLLPPIKLPLLNRAR